MRGLIIGNVVRSGPRQARVARGRDHRRSARDAVHDVPVGRVAATERLPLRAAALGRRARHAPDPDQERAREPELRPSQVPPARRATAPRRSRSAVRPASSSGSSAWEESGGSPALRAVRTTCGRTRRRSGSRMCSRRAPASCATRRSRGVSGCGGCSRSTTARATTWGCGWRTRLRVGRTGGSDERPCAFAEPERSFADRIPCPNGPGRIGVNTEQLAEGTQALRCARAGHGRQCRRLQRRDRADRQHAARASRCPRRRRRWVAQQQRLRGRLDQSARTGPGTDRGGRLQALPGRSRQLHARRADAGEDRAHRGRGSRARRVVAVAVAS